jgi:hypothetical protein
VVTARIHVLLFSLICVFGTFTESVELAYNFVLLAVSREVARFAIVVAVVALFLVAFAEVVAELLLRFTLMDCVEVHWFWALGLVVPGGLSPGRESLLVWLEGLSSFIPIVCDSA